MLITKIVRVGSKDGGDPGSIRDSIRNERVVTHNYLGINTSDGPPLPRELNVYSQVSGVSWKFSVDSEVLISLTFLAPPCQPKRIREVEKLLFTYKLIHPRVMS